jgi:hypothetical protein
MIAKGLRPCSRYRQVRILSLQLSINYLHKMSNHATKTRLPQDAVKVLREWHKEHCDFPYPSPEEKTQLQELTGLSDKQVSNWFTNTRRRTKSESSQSSNTSISYDFSTMTSLDRWRNSPPEFEHVSMEDIAAALAETDNAAKSHRTGRALSRQSDTSSVRVSDTGSSDSHGILSETNSITKHRRRRRKRPNVPLSKPNAGQRIFQCTFCTDAFKTKYDWTRHEASLHLPLDRWTCTPHGPRYLVPGGGVQNCVYCDLEDPSDHHLSSHRTSECCERPLAAREFYRKDHLRQHLRQVHKVESFTKAMEGWKSKLTEIRSRCGFCDAVFQLWSERNEHLAEHFRNGASMKGWKGARGFEPAVATLVRHSIPPYLISTEATAMIPFSAESGNSQQPITSKPHFPHSSTTPTSFEYLVSELGKFATAQQAQNLTPTDQMLQEKARLIVYGDNDPWNQTAADNSQWLELFKEGYGIAGPGLPDSIGPTEMPSSILAQDSNFPENLDLPWYWQSPECLAIYRRNKASFYAHHSIDPPDVVGAPTALTHNGIPSLRSNTTGLDLNLNFSSYEQDPSLATRDDWNDMGAAIQNPLHQRDHLYDPGDWYSPGTDGNTERQLDSRWEAWDAFPPDVDLDVQHLFS